ncbi:MAG: hypothetical protein Q9222_000949 [Ikaeria aurantiellina]
MERAGLLTRITFAFTGQGAQWYAMGRELTQTSAVFRESLEKSTVIILQLGASWNLLDELLLDQSSSRINQSWLAQPSTTAIQIALVDLLASTGVRPHTVIGHSSGEIAAAYAGGMLSQVAAIRVSYFRGLVVEAESSVNDSKGAMLAVGLSEGDVLRHISNFNYSGLCIACVNSPISTTVSGDAAAIDKLHDQFQSLAIFSRKLNVHTAYHSPHMLKSSVQYLQHLKGLETQNSVRTTRFISTVTASQKSTGFGADYWAENLVSKVRYNEAVSELCHLELSSNRPRHVIIEIGPHAALRGAFQQTVDGRIDGFDYRYLATLVRGRCAVESYTDLCGKLFEQGVTLDLKAVRTIVSSKSNPRIIPTLPNYPWDHSRRYWHESRLSKNSRSREDGPHHLLGARTASSTILEPCWRYHVGLETHPWLQDHVIDSLKVLPGASYVCMVIEAARQIFANSSQKIKYAIELTDVHFWRVLVISEAPAKIELYLSLVKPLQSGKSANATDREFRISSPSEDGVWHEYCTGRVGIRTCTTSADACNHCIPWSSEQSGAASINSPENTTDIELDTDDIYRSLRSEGNLYGPCFANIEKAQLHEGSILYTSISIPKIQEPTIAGLVRPHIVHPATLDAVLHSALPLYARLQGPSFVIPTRIQCLLISSQVDHQPRGQLHAKTNLTLQDSMTATADIEVMNHTEPSNVVLQVSGIELRGSSQLSRADANAAKPSMENYCMMWDVDANFLRSSTFALRSTVDSSNNRAWRLATLNGAALEYIDQALRKLDVQSCSPPQTHVRRLKEWMHRQPSAANFMDNGDEKEDVVYQNQLQALGMEGQLIRCLGSRLAPILMGHLKPLDVMLEDDLLYKMLEDESTTWRQNCLARYLHYLSFKNPQMRILGIGAHTSYITFSVLASLGWSKESARFNHYDIANTLAGVSDHAESIAQNWEHLVASRRLDISGDPMAQGFDTDSYDLIIISSVGHDGHEVKENLANVRKLLAPEGKLAVVVNRPDVDYQDMYELPSSKDDWQVALTNQPFTSLDLTVNDDIGLPSPTWLLVASAVPAQDLLPVNIVVPEDSHTSTKWIAGALQSKLEEAGRMVRIVEWHSYRPRIDPIHVIIDAEECAILSGPSPTRFQQITQLLSEARNILWLSWHIGNDGAVDPETALINGLARTAHAENQSLRLVTLNIEQSLDSNSITRLLSIVSPLLARSFSSAVDQRNLDEREYIYKDDELLIPRIVPESKSQAWISGRKRTPISMRPLGNDIGGDLQSHNCGRDIKSSSAESGHSSPEDTYPLDEDGSYVIAGGLGDIGRRLSRLMARRGAKHIVVLSRQEANRESCQKIEEDLQAISDGLKFYWIKCDVSNTLQVQKCASHILSIGIPAVKGVVQAALALKDRTLSRMTNEDFNHSLHAKMRGTQNLYDAFKHSPLDFFIMLSSITGVIGTAGQASYVAGNVFQDAFALNQPPKTFPFISLDLGLIQDSEIKNPKVEQNLARHGSVPITAEHLLSLLDYSMSPQAIQDDCKQLIVGINAASLAAADIANATASTLMFSHIRKDSQDHLKSEEIPGSQDIRTTISNTSDRVETQKLILNAMIGKVSRLVSFDSHGQNSDVSLTELGLDSLIAIDFRNWVSTELEAAIHISEMLDQANLRSLADLIASRSTLVKKQSDTISVNEDEIRKSSSIKAESDGSALYREEVRTIQPVLPEQPLPELETTLEMYLDSRRAFLSPQELQHTSEAIEDFLEPGLFGRVLQSRLQARVEDPSIENWISEPYSRKIYLERRDPVHPCGTFFASHISTETAHSQAERAAIIAVAALEFKNMVEGNTLEQELLNGEPICTQSMRWLFSAVREPGMGVDQMHRYNDCEYMVAIRRGHFFKVSLRHGSERVSHARLQAAINHVIICSEDKQISVASLSADERDSWARVSKQSFRESPD